MLPLFRIRVEVAGSFKTQLRHDVSSSRREHFWRPFLNMIPSFRDYSTMAI